MGTRDKVFLMIGLLVGIVGVVVTLIWRVDAGIVALLMLNLLVLAILLLQRRQLAKVQQRTLALMNSRERPSPVPSAENLDASKVRQDLKISNKKLVGLLQAQQTNLDLLNNKLESLLEKSGERETRNV